MKVTIHDQTINTSPKTKKTVNYPGFSKSRQSDARNAGQPLAAQRGFAVAGYAAEDFDRMVAETKPDGIIVTTKDAHHDEYLCRAMERGCDAITEKPCHPPRTRYPCRQAEQRPTLE